MSGLPTRITDKIERRDDGCWVWTASTDRLGYGRVGWRGSVPVAHRVVYTILRGAIPEGMVLDHLCRNRACVNPDHLEAVAHRENVLRGIGPTAINSRKTHCNHGHEFLAGSYFIDNRGARQCLSCHRKRNREWVRRARAARKVAACQG